MMAMTDLDWHAAITDFMRLETEHVSMLNSLRWRFSKSYPRAAAPGAAHDGDGHPEHPGQDAFRASEGILDIRTSYPASSDAHHCEALRASEGFLARRLRMPVGHARAS